LKLRAAQARRSAGGFSIVTIGKVARYASSRVGPGKAPAR